MLAITWRAQAARRLEAAGSPDPMADARLLSWGDSLRELPPQEEARLEALLKRRLAGEPVQYILGSAWFMGLEFYVDRRVLIPRQDTEVLCEAALAFLQGMASPRVLDLCAGSGAIGLSLAKLCPQASVTLADISADACAVIAENRLRLGVEAEAVEGDLFAPLPGGSSTSLPAIPPISARGSWRRCRQRCKKSRAWHSTAAQTGCVFTAASPRNIKNTSPRAAHCFWRSAGTRRKTCARCLAAGACCAI